MSSTESPTPKGRGTPTEDEIIPTGYPNDEGVEFRAFVESWFDKHPQLRDGHGNSLSVKQAYEDVLFPKLRTMFPSTCVDGTDWKKAAIDIMQTKKANLRRRKRRSSSSCEDRGEYSKKQCNIPPPTRPGLMVMESRVSSTTSLPATVMPGRPFERVIMVVRNKSSGEERSCMVQELIKAKTFGKRIIEPSELRWTYFTRWLREVFGVTDREILSISNVGGSAVHDERSFQAFSAEQYWDNCKRVCFELDVESLPNSVLPTRPFGGR